MTDDLDQDRVTFPWGPEGWALPESPDDHPLRDSLHQWVADADAADRMPWRVTVTFAYSEDRVMPVGVELIMADGSPITARAWRSVRVQEVIDEARRRYGRELQREVRTDPHDWGGLTAEDVAAEFRERSRQPGRPGRPRSWPDEHFREVVAVYREAQQLGSRRPIRDVADHFERQGMADVYGQAKGWVSEAKRRGFFDETKGGEQQ